MMLTGKLPTVRCSVANWMRKPWAIFGLPCPKVSRWDMAVSATGYVQQQASGAPRSGRGDPQVSRIKPETAKRKPISGSEQG